jgi:hypothetical protein
VGKERSGYLLCVLLYTTATVRDSLHTPPFMLFMPTSPFTLTGQIQSIQLAEQKTIGSIICCCCCCCSSSSSSSSSSGSSCGSSCCLDSRCPLDCSMINYIMEMFGICRAKTLSWSDKGTGKTSIGSISRYFRKVPDWRAPSTPSSRIIVSLLGLDWFPKGQTELEDNY